MYHYRPLVKLFYRNYRNLLFNNLTHTIQPFFYLIKD
jgi:hypothetical protein